MEVNAYDYKGRKLPSGRIIIDERVSAVKEAKHHVCVLCGHAGVSDLVKCDVCFDEAHVYCLCAAASGGGELPGWLAERGPTREAVRQMKAEAGELWARLSRAKHDQKIRTSHANNFVCATCHAIETSLKKTKRCIFCGSHKYQSSIIKCKSSRCHSGIHVFCASILERLPVSSLDFVDPENLSERLRLSEDPTDLMDRETRSRNPDYRLMCFWKCPSCEFQALIDEERDDAERQIPAKFLFQSEVDEKCLSVGLLRETDHNRSVEWAKAWCGEDFHLDEVEGLKVMESARKRRAESGSKSAAIGPAKSPFNDEDWKYFDSLVSALSDDTVESCIKVKQPKPRHSSAHVKSSRMNFGCKSCASIMTPTPPTYEILDLSSRQESVQSESAEATCSSEDEESIQQNVQWLEFHVNLRAIASFVFPAIAREFDELNCSDLPPPIRLNFGEHWDRGSRHGRWTEDGPLEEPPPSLRDNAAAAPAFIPTRTHQRYGSSSGRLEKVRAIKGTPKTMLTLSLTRLQTFLTHLYERLEEIFGRDPFRQLWLSAEERKTFLAGESELLPLLRSWPQLADFHHSQHPLSAHFSHLLSAFKDDFTNLKDSIAEAEAVIRASGRLYQDDPVYHPFVEPSVNRPAVPGRVPVEEVFLRMSKVFTGFGIMPPLKFATSAKFGVYVIARGSIPRGTIIGEYSGVIEPMKWNTGCVFAISDSIYDLPTSVDSKHALVVLPEPYTNIARYILGVNNQKRNYLAEVNVRTSPYELEDGTQRLFVEVVKDISPGEPLYLNYNAGKDPLYPTHDFS